MPPVQGVPVLPGQFSGSSAIGFDGADKIFGEQTVFGVIRFYGKGFLLIEIRHGIENFNDNREEDKYTNPVPVFFAFPAKTCGLCVKKLLAKSRS